MEGTIWVLGARDALVGGSHRGVSRAMRVLCSSTGVVVDGRVYITGFCLAIPSSVPSFFLYNPFLCYNNDDFNDVNGDSGYIFLNLYCSSVCVGAWRKTHGLVSIKTCTC